MNALKKGCQVWVVDTASAGVPVSKAIYLRTSDDGLVHFCRFEWESGRGTGYFASNVYETRKQALDRAIAELESSLQQHKSDRDSCN